MAVFNDGGTNYFVGDCLYGNHDINYDTTDYLQASEQTDIVADLTTFMSNLSYSSPFIGSQADFDTLGATKSLLAWKATADPTTHTHRHIFQHGYFNVGAGGTYMYQTNSASTIINTGGFLAGWGSQNTGVNVANTQWVACGDVAQNAIALAKFHYGTDRSLKYVNFYYAGTLTEVNTNFGYYDQDIRNYSVCLYFTRNQPGTDYYLGEHYIGGAEKALLQTGDADYSIVCSDLQSPTATWATGAYLFDNDSDLGFPCIGRAKNLALADGTYTLGKPVKLDTAIYTGFNRWLPVGNFAGKTLLMRCYSSLP